MSFRFLERIPRFRTRGIVALVFLVSTVFFVLPESARAGVGGTMADLIAAIAEVVIELGGKLLVVFIEILMAVVRYNDFINAAAVTKGWVLVRDFSNMAFLIIFIAIAFATILGVERYEWKQLLPKLMLMAVLINFSKTICGIIIDAAQVIMIAFVNGFKDVAVGNLIRGFGLNDMISFGALEGASGPTPTAIAGASILAVALMTVAVITLGAIIAMLVLRIIVLWILVVLAPLAFMLNAAPGFENKFQDWWSSFVRHAFVGPILAFFLWLSFSIMATVAPGSNLATDSKIPFDTVSERTSATVTAISRSDQLLSYGISIALLMMSLSFANSLGVKGGDIAGSALNKIKSGGVKLGKLAALGVATGGFGAIAGYGVYKGGKKFAGTAVGKWTGRRLDEAITPGLSKGLGRLGQKIFKDPNSRLGMASAKLAEHGVLLRTIKRGWKDRGEAREKNITATYAGNSRDIFHAVLDKQNTNYKFRNKMALDVEEAKKQKEELGGDSEASLNLIFDALRNGDTDTKTIRGATINTWGNNDQNEETLSTEAYEVDANGNTIRTVGEEVHRRVLANFERAISDEGKANVDTYVAAQKKLREAVENGASAEELFRIRTQEIDPAREKLKPLEYQYAHHKMMKATDSPFARMEVLKMKLADKNGNISEDAARFATRLSGIALENGNYAGFGLAGSENGVYELADLYSEAGFAKYNGTVTGKMRNINPSELLRKAHPSALRNEVIDEDGMRYYDDEFNSVGQNLMIQASTGISERNFNLRPDASNAAVGTTATRQYPDLFSIDSDRRARAREDYADDNLAGYNFSLRSFVSPEAHIRTMSGYLQRQGVSPEDVQMTPRQSLQKLQAKLPQRKEELADLNQRLQQASAVLQQAITAQAPQAEQERLQEQEQELRKEADKAAIDVNRIKEQIARFVANVRVEDLDKVPPREQRGGGGGGGGATPPTGSAPAGGGTTSGPTIAMPGSPEFRQTEEDLRRRPPQT